MSRIHEALRKAEQERLSKPAPGGRTDLADLNPDARMSSVLDRRNGRLPALSSQPSGVEGPLNFEVLANRCAHLNWRIDPQMSVFEAGEEGTVGAESFRTLRSRLVQIAGIRPLRRVLITSSAPGEGKSFTASNLAQCFALQPDCRVLLIDGDLRASRLHFLLGAPNTPGLTNYLRGETDELSVIQMDAQNSFAFLPGGDAVADPSELILGGQMKKLLELVTPIFDWVILDSPPALAVHDANLLADLCDGVLFIVKAGETSYENAAKASAEFRERNLLGVVLNQVEKVELYRGYYGRGYGSDRK